MKLLPLVALCAVISCNAAEVFSPPQQLQCTGEVPNFSCQLDPASLKYLVIMSYLGDPRSGTYKFEKAYQLGDTMPPIFVYKDANGNGFELDATHNIVAAVNAPGAAWQASRMPGYYQCIAQAESCPYTNVPFAKSK